MNIAAFQYSPIFDDLAFDTIAQHLIQSGYIILKNSIPGDMLRALQSLACAEDDTFQAAGIGREQDHQLNRIVRRDKIKWLDAVHPIEAAYLNHMEALRIALNKRLFLGLFDYESHFAHYPPGAFYKKHLDAFKGQTNRVLTTVCYLNEAWEPSDGGDLLLYSMEDQLIERVTPEAGTLVIFLSDEFPHEVTPAQKDRYSIAGWFRVNMSSALKVDPAH